MALNNIGVAFVSYGGHMTNGYIRATFVVEQHSFASHS